MIGKLPFLAVFVSTWIAPVSQEEVDVAHYVPGAQRKVFETRVERTAQRVALRLDGRSYDLSELLGREPSGTAEWNLSVRDSPKFEEGQLVFVQRDYEDVVLRAGLSEGPYAILDHSSASLEVYGGMERERVSFDSNSPHDAWEVLLPKSSPLKKDGLLGLAARVDLSAFRPPDQPVPGQTWTVPASAFEELLFPVGHPATLLAPKGWARIADNDVPMGGALDTAKGSLKACWVGFREGSSKQVSEIELEVEGELQLSPATAFVAAGQVYFDGRDYASGVELGRAEALDGQLQLRVQGTGTLLWNHELRAFERLDLPLEFHAELEAGVDWSLARSQLAFTLEVDLEGSLELHYSRKSKVPRSRIQNGR